MILIIIINLSLLKYYFYILNLEEIGINAGNWVDSAQNTNYWRALVNPALNLRVP